ncbi:hypothetical protein AG0111_0g8708 [Alternaria gaisen]|uniref:Uncharacterized protein n=1 Tax=Alternaria gaisen TaxID=167740 RepID=A0ACB6FF42_9PLEO|nr:hypothetical protein AG0111_0g8708 [Alternaria gaisen]
MLPVLLVNITKRSLHNGSARRVLTQYSRSLTITCRGKSITREELFKYTNGRFLANEKEAANRRYVKFDVDQLCAVAATTDGKHSPVCAIEKMEGGFSKALLMRKEDGTEAVAKIPCTIAGPPKYTTASEVAILRYFPVPKVLAWNADASNPVGAEYIIMTKAPGVQLYKVWDDMDELDRIQVVRQLAEFEGQNMSSFGIALVERELARLEKSLSASTSSAPRGSFEEHIAVLDMTKKVMSRLNERTLIGKVSEPVLWHTDLHMGNVYVAEGKPAQILSIIDWQSILVSPLFLQARFPDFVTVGDDYLPGVNNIRGWKVLQIPLFLRELFVRCAEASEEGVVPLRACLIEYAANWKEIGFEGECPISFSEEELQRHEQQFEEYSNYHKVHELARNIVGTDFEGWISLYVDFEMKRQQNAALLEEFMRKSSQYGMSSEQMREIWPYLDRSTSSPKQEGVAYGFRRLLRWLGIF